MTQVVPSVTAAGRVPSTVLTRAGSVVLAAGAVMGSLTMALVVGLPLNGPDDSALSRVAAAAFVVGMTVLATVGTVLIRRRPTHPMGWWIAGTGLTCLLSRFIAGYAGAADAGQLPLPDVLLWSTNWIWVPAQVAALEVLLRFPDGRLPGARWRPAEWALLAWGLCATLVTAILPGPLGQSNLDHLGNPYGAAALRSQLDAALSPLFAVMPVLSVVCAAALILRWRGSEGEERQQLRWVAAATAALALAAPFAVLGDVPELALALAYLLVPAAISFAMLRTHLWDLGIVIRRSAVYGAVVALLAVGYVAAVASFNSRATPLVAGIGMALLAVPVRELAERVLERWLFGERGDPGLVARALARRLNDSGEPVLQSVVDQLSHSLRLPDVAITSDSGSVLASSRPVTSAAQHAVGAKIPLAVRGTRVGWLLAYERAPGEGLGPRDLAILEQVAQPAGLAVHALRLDADLRASHERLLTVRSQERARLQRDLHDGLGPTLGGITLRAEAARNLIRAGAPGMQVDDVLAQVGEATEGAVAEIRRLIDDLRPTSLEQFGLRRALLDATADVIGGVTISVQIPEVIGPLDARAEVATYRIAVEALRNVHTHARASSCRLRLDVDGRRVVLEVTDDGIGVDGAVPGVGMTSMSDRAREVGGSVEITSIHPGPGTRVLAYVPAGTA